MVWFVLFQILKLEEKQHELTVTLQQEKSQHVSLQDYSKVINRAIDCLHGLMCVTLVKVVCIVVWSIDSTAYSRALVVAMIALVISVTLAVDSHLRRNERK